MSPGGGGGRFGIPVEAVEVWMGWGSWVTWGIDACVWASVERLSLFHCPRAGSSFTGGDSPRSQSFGSE